MSKHAASSVLKSDRPSKQQRVIEVDATTVSEEAAASQESSSNGSDNDDSARQGTNRFFREWFDDGEAPWFMRPRCDILRIAPERGGDDPDMSPLGLYGEREKARALFARNLVSYPHGTIVFKECAPWGRLQCLRNQGFILQEKIVDDDGTMYAAIVEFSDGPLNEKPRLLLTKEYCEGWVSAVQLQERYEYHS